MDCGLNGNGGGSYHGVAQKMERFARRPVRIQTAVVMPTVPLVRELSGVVLTIVNCEEGGHKSVNGL